MPVGRVPGKARADVGGRPMRARRLLARLASGRASLGLASLSSCMTSLSISTGFLPLNGFLIVAGVMVIIVGLGQWA